MHEPENDTQPDACSSPCVGELLSVAGSAERSILVRMRGVTIHIEDVEILSDPVWSEPAHEDD